LKKRNAIIAGQVGKQPRFNQSQKPIIGETILSKGFTNGVVETYFTKSLVLAPGSSTLGLFAKY